jgi:hypothetical protein
MSGQRVRLTLQQEHFVKLVVEEGHSLVGAYRISYPPRQGQRSAQGERVAAKLLAHRPLIQQRMEELREELRAGDPVELRRRANAVLGRILEQRLDPRYRRTALDVLRYLDAQEREVERSERESLRTAIAALDAIDGTKGRGRSSATRLHTNALFRESKVEVSGEERTNEYGRPSTPSTSPRVEIDQVVEERCPRAYDTVPPAPPGADPQLDEASEAAEGEAAPTEPKLRWVRKPGHFGRGGWIQRAQTP